jgi:hypothetical protein
MKTDQTRELTATESSRADLRTAIAHEEACHPFRLLATMVQGGPSALPEAWRSYSDVHAARLAAHQMVQDRRALRVAIVEDRPPLQFVEWVEKVVQAQLAAAARDGRGPHTEETRNPT